MLRQSQLAALSLIVGAGVFCACEPAASGACDGKIDGDVFNLVVYNCIDQDIYIEYNLRNVGKVDPINKDDVCGVTYIGALPQCSTGEITADGYQLYSTRLVWSDSLMLENTNGCWVSVIYDRVIGQEVSSNYTLPSLPAQVPAETNDCLPLNLEEPEGE